MARKKKKKEFPIELWLWILKVVGVIAVSTVLGFFVFTAGRNFVLESNYFRVEIVESEKTLGFINTQDLQRFVGGNIFTIDLKDAQDKLSYKYPQAAQLRIVKYFPNKIKVVAKTRLPFAQAKIGEKILTLDDNAIVLSTTSKEDVNLPVIEGIFIQGDVILGLPLTDQRANVALDVIKAFYDHLPSSSYKIKRMNVENLSQVYFFIKDDLRIIVDHDKINRKMRILNVVLNEGRVDLTEVKYIDLRFKEPILGKK